jgi:DNA-binding transcriptional LysR family regulator
MRTNRNRGVSVEEHRFSPSGPAPDWDAVRMYLEVSRHGSFRAAAQYLRISVNPLRHRIKQLERDLDATLFTRHRDGVRPTAEGLRYLNVAKVMEEASFGLLRAKAQVPQLLEGEVKVAVTEGLGTFWIIPRLVEFQRAHPGLLVNIQCAMHSADVLRLEADVAIQLKKPSDPDIKMVKLGRLHSMPFAGRSYLDTYGEPKTVADLENHRLVLQVADQTETRRLYDQVFPGKAWAGFVSVVTNVSTAHAWAIAKGAGVGWVPTYIHALGGRFVPLGVPARFPFDIWLTYHPDVGRIPRVRRMIDWTVAAFDPRKFPWFRDQFIHPNDLPHAYAGKPLANMFEGFVHAEHFYSPNGANSNNRRTA